MSQVGSPVVGASVSAGGQTEFRDLRDPVIVVLRLNPVPDGVRIISILWLRTCTFCNREYVLRYNVILYLL